MGNLCRLTGKDRKRKLETGAGPGSQISQDFPIRVNVLAQESESTEGVLLPLASVAGPTAWFHPIAGNLAASVNCFGRRKRA